MGKTAVANPVQYLEKAGGGQAMELARFYRLQMELLEPLLGQLAAGAAAQGGRLQAQLGARLGAAGIGGSTGVGSLLRGVGTSFAAQEIGERRLQASLQALTQAAQLSSGVLQSFTGVEQSRLQAAGSQQAPWERVLGAIAGGLGALAPLGGGRQKQPGAGGGSPAPVIPQPAPMFP